MATSPDIWCYKYTVKYVTVALCGVTVWKFIYITLWGLNEPRHYYNLRRYIYSFTYNSMFSSKRIPVKPVVRSIKPFDIFTGFWGEKQIVRNENMVVITRSEPALNCMLHVPLWDYYKTHTPRIYSEVCTASACNTTTCVNDNYLVFNCIIQTTQSIQLLKLSEAMFRLALQNTLQQWRE